MQERDEAEIVSYFDKSLAANLADGSEIHRRRPDLGMSLDAINDYIRMFDYRISDEAMDAPRSVQRDGSAPSPASCGLVSTMSAVTAKNRRRRTAHAR